MKDKVIKALESNSQWKPQWILVDERLPENEGYYLVTDDAGGMRSVEHSFFVPDSEAPWDYVNVIAWMPLPEPYKERKEK